MSRTRVWLDAHQTGRVPVVAGIVAMWAIGVLRLFYVHGTGEHDAFMMAAGVVRGAQTGQVLNPFCYGDDLQFLFYYLFHAVSAPWSPSTESVLLTMNVVGALCALAAPLLLLPLLRRLLRDRAKADLVVLLAVASPVYFYLVSYGHPFHLALVLAIAAWLLLARSFDKTGGVRWEAATGIALLALAMMMRFEQVVLLSGLFAALLTLESERPFRRLVEGAAAVGAAAVLFAVGRHALVPPVDRLVTAQSGGFFEQFSLLLLTLNPDGVKWGISHMVAEVGIPQLFLGAGGTLIALYRRQPKLLLVAAGGLLPTLAVYIGNPSPPRHFFVLVLGLAVTIAIASNTQWVSNLKRLTIAILAFNLLLPWGLIAVDGRRLPGRANITYNVVERTDRNQRQIDEAHAFYRAVIARAQDEPVVVFGSWIHVAELAAILVNDPAVTFGPGRLPDGSRALTFAGRGLQLSFVESYDGGLAAGEIARLRTMAPRVRFLTLIENARPVNDLRLGIPPAMMWWNS